MVRHSMNTRNMIELACIYDWFEMKAWPIQCQMWWEKGCFGINDTWHSSFNIQAYFAYFYGLCYSPIYPCIWCKKIENPSKEKPTTESFLLISRSKAVWLLLITCSHIHLKWIENIPPSLFYVNTTCIWKSVTFWANIYAHSWINEIVFQFAFSRLGALF